MVIWLERGLRGADLHMPQRMPLPLTVSCFSKIQIGFSFLVPAHPGSPGQKAVKRVCVCACLNIVCSRWAYKGCYTCNVGICLASVFRWPLSPQVTVPLSVTSGHFNVISVVTFPARHCCQYCQIVLFDERGTCVDILPRVALCILIGFLWNKWSFDVMWYLCTLTASVFSLSDIELQMCVFQILRESTPDVSCVFRFCWVRVLLILFRAAKDNNWLIHCFINIFDGLTIQIKFWPSWHH